MLFCCKMYYTYILKSLVAPSQYYIGSTGNLRLRLGMHNGGYVKHTSKFAPWDVAAYFAFKTKKVAIDFERYLKTGSGRAFANRHFRGDDNK